MARLGNLGTRGDGVPRARSCITSITGSCLLPSPRWGSVAALAWLAQSHRAGGGRAGRGTSSCSAWVQVRSTWRTPDEWNGLEPAARAVASTVPADAWVVAPEALLFQADRRGCRMEWSDAAAARAAGEWEAGTTGRWPARTGRILSPPGGSVFRRPGQPRRRPARKGLHDAVRRRYKVIVDRPDVIIAELADSETHWNAN